MFPKHSTVQPWEVHQNYFRDYKSLKIDAVKDKYMQFSM